MRSILDLKIQHIDNIESYLSYVNNSHRRISRLVPYFDSPSAPAGRMREFAGAAAAGRRGRDRKQYQFCLILRRTPVKIPSLTLSPTQIYTEVSIQQLQRIHALTHPAAKSVVAGK